jgi:hypothetical protein
MNEASLIQTGKSTRAANVTLYESATCRRDPERDQGAGGNKRDLRDQRNGAIAGSSRTRFRRGLRVSSPTIA